MTKTIDKKTLPACTKPLFIRDVEESLHNAFKAACCSAGVSMTEAVKKFLTEVATGKRRP